MKDVIAVYMRSMSNHMTDRCEFSLYIWLSNHMTNRHKFCWYIQTVDHLTAKQVWVQLTYLPACSACFQSWRTCRPCHDSTTQRCSRWSRATSFLSLSTTSSSSSRSSRPRASVGGSHTVGTATPAWRTRCSPRSSTMATCPSKAPRGSTPCRAQHSRAFQGMASRLPLASSRLGVPQWWWWWWWLIPRRRGFGKVEGQSWHAVLRRLCCILDKQTKGWAEDDREAAHCLLHASFFRGFMPLCLKLMTHHPHWWALCWSEASCCLDWLLIPACASCIF